MTPSRVRNAFTMILGMVASSTRTTNHARPDRQTRQMPTGPLSAAGDLRDFAGFLRLQSLLDPATEEVHPVLWPRAVAWHGAGRDLPENRIGVGSNVLVARSEEHTSELQSLR